MRIIFLLILVISTLISCHESPSNDRAHEQELSAPILQAEDIEEKFTPLAANHFLHTFSHPDNADTFKIFLIGTSPLAATATFEIISHEGRQLYIEHYPARLLLDYGLDPYANEQIQEDYIRHRLKEFFAIEHFTTPALAADAEWEEEYAEKSIWEVIKADRTAVGFFYLLGEEDGRNIAYSKQLQKVVLYHSCC